MIAWEQDADGVVVLTMDNPERSANTMGAGFVAALGDSIERLEAEREQITGVILTSAKKTFLAGADLEEIRMIGPGQAAEIAANSAHIKGLLRRIELLERPVVAAIGGAALGGGLELALACHHRILVDDPRVKVGLPEVQLGVLPGAGGVVRSVRMLGVTDALMQLLLTGNPLRPQEALDLGIVGELVATREELVPAAKAWIAARAGDDPIRQPWDTDGYRLPGGTPASPALAANLPAFPANLRKQLKGANYPAPRAIMAAAVEGAQVDFDSAMKIEERYFAQLVTSQVAKNMIQAFFFDMQAVNNRPRVNGSERYVAEKLVVLGAGMMGAGIGYVCAKAGIEVVLKDVSLESAQRGKGYSEGLCAKAVEKGRMTQEKADALLARITPTADPADASGADAVIEAVFEDPALKAQVFTEIEPYLAPGALLASNTSTLPITGLAADSARPADFIGMHFSSPVDKMPPIEVIVAEQTSQQTLQRAIDLTQQIGKVPIVVNDGRGFFTSRVILTFVNEGVAMLGEGVPAATIEQAASQAGYPAGVLQLIDEINMETAQRIRDATLLAVEAEGGAPRVHPAEPIVDRMVELARPGRLRGAGFYDYDGGKRAGLWPGLRDEFPPVADPSQIILRDLSERMLFIEAIEAVRCFDEGVIESTADANIGSILMTGYPGWTGGVVQYVEGYEDPRHGHGRPAFVARALELAERYGERFQPPESLLARINGAS